MSNIVRSVILTILAMLSLHCLGAQPQSITILHTNDIHAAALPHEATWIREDPKPMIGGFKELWWTVDSIRHVKNDVLVLDAGDVMTGTPIGEYFYHGAIGGALFEMMNEIGYDAWTIGNHDLDISQDNLRKLTEIARFPTVSANLTDSAGNFPFHNKQYLIVTKGGVRIGIIGLMSRDLFQLTNRNNLRGLKVASPFETAQTLIDKIAPETDLIIALTHEGLDDDSVLAVSTHGLNVIIGGHSHTRLKTPKLINGVIICQTGANCENLGELDLTVDHHSVTSYNGKLIPLWARNDRPENKISKLIDDLDAKVKQEYGEVLGTLEHDWKRSRGGESNIGQFVADATREGVNADIGIGNSSGIRKDLPAGKITKLDLFEISPFHNYVCTFTYTGAEVRQLVQHYVRGAAHGRTSLDLSGIYCEWKRIDGNPEIVSIKVNGKEVEDGKTYTCATNDFIISQGTKYLPVAPVTWNTTSVTVQQALIEKVQHDKTIKGVVEARFQEIH
jgi:5'-nucleotidase/UDP-sugar diphosphatase